MNLAKVNSIVPPAINTVALAQLFTLLGDETRLRILLLLRDKELAVQDLATALDLSHSAISHQLRLLRFNHLVKGRKAGRSVYYALEDQCVWDLLAAGGSHLHHGSEEEVLNNDL